MKKKVLIGVGLVVVGVALFVVKERSKVEKSKVKSQSEISGTAEIDGLKPGAGRIEMSEVNVDATSPSHSKPKSQRGGDTASTENLSEAVKALLGLDGKVRNYPELMQEIGILSKGKGSGKGVSPMN